MKAVKTILHYPVQIDSEDVQMRMQVAMQVSNLHIKEIADMLGTSVDRLKHYIANAQHLNINFLLSFAAITGCTVTDLIPGLDELLPFPYTVIPGGGFVSPIAPDPYTVGFEDERSRTTVIRK